MTDSTEQPSHLGYKPDARTLAKRSERLRRLLARRSNPRMVRRKRSFSAAKKLAKWAQNAPLRVSHDWVNKHDPEPGGYYVVYADGYASHSPAKAFEEGYTRI